MSTRVLFIIVIIICFVNVVFAKQIAVYGVRNIMPSLPEPVRRFYEASGFGRPLDGRFWINVRATIAGAIGAFFIILTILDARKR